MTEVVFVGTSDAFGAGGRRQTCIAVRAAQGTVLLDCGPTTNTGLTALGISRDEIDAVIVSHFHGDHISGIPLLLLGARYQDERTRPIQILGPPGIEERVRTLAKAMAHSFDRDDWTFPIEFVELDVGVEAAAGAVKVRSFPTYHNEDTCPHGLMVEVDGKRVAFSGDTGWFKELPDLVRGVDLFICECTFPEAGYEYHINLRELTARKDELDCQRIVITHLGTQMSELRGKCGFETADDGLRIIL